MRATRIGRPPIEDRRLVRDKYFTFKLTAAELHLIRKLCALEQAERARRGMKGGYTVSRYLRDLVAADAERRGVLE